MNEDRKDAIEVEMGDGGGGETVEAPPDHAAVRSMRSVIDKLENKEILSVVEVITANMERMVVAGCNDKHWKKIRYRSVMGCFPQ